MKSWLIKTFKNKFLIFKKILLLIKQDNHLFSKKFDRLLKEKILIISIQNKINNFSKLIGRKVNNTSEILKISKQGSMDLQSNKL